MSGLERGLTKDQQSFFSVSGDGSSLLLDLKYYLL